MNLRMMTAISHEIEECCYSKVPYMLNANFARLLCPWEFDCDMIVLLLIG